MNFDQWIKLLGLLLPFLQYLLWPVLILLAMLYFGGAIKRFIGNIGEFSGKVSTAGLEISANQKIDALTASAALGAASANKTEDETIDQLAFDDSKAREIAEVVSQAITPPIAQKLAGAAVLWIDTLPFQTIYERMALVAIDIHITVVDSFENALDKMRQDTYSCIILRMAVDDDTIEQVCRFLRISRRISVSFIIIYGTSNADEQKEEVLRQGAYGVVNKPNELFKLAVRAIEKQPLAEQYQRVVRTQHIFKAEEAVFTWLHTKYPENRIEGGIRDYHLLMIDPNGNSKGITIIYVERVTSHFFAIEKKSEQFEGSFERPFARRAKPTDKAPSSWSIYVVPDKTTAERLELELVDFTSIKPILRHQNRDITIGYIEDNSEFRQFATIQARPSTTKNGTTGPVEY